MTKAWLTSHLSFLWTLWPWLFSDRQIFLLTRFTQLFFMYRSKIYTIYIHFTNSSDALEIGQDSDRTRSWQPRWPITGHYFFNMRKICKPNQIARPLLLTQMCSFRWGYTMKKFNLIKFKMADLQPFLTSIWVITGKPCQILILPSKRAIAKALVSVTVQDTANRLW